MAINMDRNTHTHTHSVLTAIFPGEPGLANMDRQITVITV